MFKDSCGTPLSEGTWQTHTHVSETARHFTLKNYRKFIGFECFENKQATFVSEITSQCGQHEEQCETALSAGHSRLICHNI